MGQSLNFPVTFLRQLYWALFFCLLVPVAEKKLIARAGNGRDQGWLAVQALACVLSSRLIDSPISRPEDTFSHLWSALLWGTGQEASSSHPLH